MLPDFNKYLTLNPILVSVSHLVVLLCRMELASFRRGYAWADDRKGGTSGNSLKILYLVPFPRLPFDLPQSERPSSCFFPIGGD